MHGKIASKTKFKNCATVNKEKLQEHQMKILLIGKLILSTCYATHLWYSPWLTGGEIYR